jgi:hypothetical protein
MNPNHNTSQVLDHREDLPELPNISSSFTDDKESGAETQPVVVIGGVSEAIATPKGADSFLGRRNNAKYGALIPSKSNFFSLNLTVPRLDLSTRISLLLCRSL